MIGIDRINTFITILICTSIILSLGFNIKLLDGGTPIFLSQLVFIVTYILFLTIFLLVSVFSHHRMDLNFLSLFLILIQKRD